LAAEVGSFATRVQTSAAFLAVAMLVSAIAPQADARTRAAALPPRVDVAVGAQNALPRADSLRLDPLPSEAGSVAASASPVRPTVAAPAAAALTRPAFAPVVAALTAASPASASAAAAASSPKPLTFDALRNAVSLADVQISPDGTRVAYIREHNDYKANETLTEIELIDVATGRSRALTHGRHGVSKIRWSPKGDALAFVAAADPDKVPQLFVMPMDGGDALQVTTVKAGVADFAWRPDGSGFAFAAADPPKPLKPDGYVAAFEVTDEHFLTRAPSLPTAIWTVKSDGTGAKRITSGKLSVSPFSKLAFTPDGKTILAALQPDGVFARLSQTATMRIDATTGGAAPIVAGKLDGGGPLSHDGTKIALAIPRHGSLYLQSDISIRALADGSEVTSGVKLDRNVHWSAWTPDDKAVYVGTADGVRDVLWRLGVDGSVQHVDLGDVDFADDGSVANDGTLAFVGATRSSPGEIYLLRDPVSAPRKLTDENAWTAGYAFAKRERIDWQSDGMAVDGVLTYPIGYQTGKKYPLVLIVHGGPVATSTWDVDPYEGQLVEILAAHGDLVLQPNYRGSDNSGDAFLQAIVGGVTSGPGRDNLRGVEAVRALGIVDPARIAVGGWSGGGLQTSWLIGHASYWRAAVSGAGVDDWFEQAVLSDINEDFASTFLGGATPWTAAGRRQFAAESPLTYAAQIRTPLLILSDIGDQRVPVTQSFALYRALHDRGKTVEFMAWPRAGHFPTDPVGHESVFKTWSGWYDRWLK
jgi:dipeptidyl aminopeptidase/acylaminoacyl peptidase